MQKNLTIFGLTALITGAPVLAYLMLLSSDEEHMRQMLRFSAWSAVLIYLVVFVARPLNQLIGSPFSRMLLKNRRYVGITLAAVMTIHLVLLLIVNKQAFNIPGTTIYLLMFLMLFTSFDGAPAKIGPRNWRVLHKTGLYGLGIAYSGAIGSAFLQTPLDPVYLTLTILVLAAVAIRIAAFWKVRLKN
jgi:sulfoxide reductase heme-binding subunit YedZ